MKSVLYLFQKGYSIKKKQNLSKMNRYWFILLKKAVLKLFKLLLQYENSA